MRNDVFDVLSDDALLERMDELVRKERRVTFNVVMHLAEVERRGVYQRLGHHSMFDYCTRRLKYSESGAYRRIKTSRCIRDFPQVARLLKSGDLSVVTVAMLAGVLTPENEAGLLGAACGKSQSEVEKVVAGFRVGKPFRDRIKAVVVERPAMALTVSAEPEAKAVTPTPAQTELGQNPLHSGGENDPTLEEREPESPSHRETYYQFTIAADEEFMAMYRQVQAIHATRANPGEDISATFKGLMREYIDRHAPEKKQARQAERAGSRAKSANKLAGNETTQKRRSRSRLHAHARAKPRSRHIPTATRDHIRTRDGNRCTFVAADGTRCSATRFLQFDHVIPFASGGGHEPENLRLMCAAHNRLEAKGLFGARAELAARTHGRTQAAPQGP